jgi:hypothetical protein
MVRISKCGGGVAYVALEPEAVWARSTSPHLLILVDYDEGDSLIGVSFAGPLARTVVGNGIFAAFDQALSDEIVEPIMTPSGSNEPIVDRDELDAVRSAVESLLVFN